MSEPYWKTDPDYPGWYFRYPLRGGKFLIFAATDFDLQGVYDVELMVADPEFLHTDVDSTEWDEYWSKEGTAVGPGGTEVFGVLPGALFHMEYLIKRLGGQPIMRVGAATTKLFRIYEHFLTRKGYTRVAGELLKVLG